MHLAVGGRRFVPTNEGMNNPQYLMMFLLHPLPLSLTARAPLASRQQNLLYFCSLKP
jgi:hypothetical protein